MAINSDAGFTTYESSTETESGAESGSGGDVMSYWSQSRVEILQSIRGISFTNNSSFPIPKGVTGKSGFDIDFDSGGEARAGVAAEGKALDASGLPLSGDAVIKIGGEEKSRAVSSGQFTVTANPPRGVTSGSNTERQKVDFLFSPSSAGISNSFDDIGSYKNVGTFQYGEIKGKVTDYEGNPVSGAAVFGEGEGATTNSSGEYSIAAPGGTQVDLTSLDKTETVTKTPSAGSTITVDFQFSRLVVKVVDPELNPMVGTPVKINGDNYETNDEGRVVLERAGIKTHNVVVDGEEEISPTVSQQGELVEEQFGDAFSGYRIALREDSTDLPIQSTTVAFISGGIASQTNGNGRASTLVNTEGEKEVELGTGDRRYETKTVTVTVKNGEIKTEEGTLSRRSNAPTIS